MLSPAAVFQAGEIGFCSNHTQRYNLATIFLSIDIL